VETIVVSLPSAAYERLRQRAEKVGQTPADLSRELLVAALELPAPPQKTTREILQAAGLLSSLSPALREKIVPEVTLDEVRTALSRAGGPSLSEIIITQRGPKE
jgi:hypothetical protein